MSPPASFRFRYGLLVMLTLFFVVLGCFLDGISVVVLTTAVILPMVEAAGIDRIWLGIYIVLVVEMSQITPPVGFNLFVIQSLTGRDILWVVRAALPFFLLLVVAVILVTIFPAVVMYLPSRLGLIPSGSAGTCIGRAGRRMLPAPRS